jgi:hypothetical protein
MERLKVDKRRDEIDLQRISLYARERARTILERYCDDNRENLG